MYFKKLKKEQFFYFCTIFQSNTKLYNALEIITIYM